jgi:hypothetical protein
MVRMRFPPLSFFGRGEASSESDVMLRRNIGLVIAGVVLGDACRSRPAAAHFPSAASVAALLLLALSSFALHRRLRLAPSQ